MGTSYSELAANLISARGFSRSNRFSVDIKLPDALVSAGVVAEARLSLNCLSAPLPGKSLEVGETRYSGGYANKKAIGTNFADAELRFYLGEDLYEKQVFDAWQAFIFDPNYQTSAYPSEYYSEISVTKLSIGADEKYIGTYTMIDAFPSNVQDIEQSYESDSAVDILPVTFSYHTWFYNHTS